MANYITVPVAVKNQYNGTVSGVNRLEFRQTKAPGLWVAPESVLSVFPGVFSGISVTPAVITKKSFPDFDPNAV